jgi:hypothetical protein
MENLIINDKAKQFYNFNGYLDMTKILIIQSNINVDISIPIIKTDFFKN